MVDLAHFAAQVVFAVGVLAFERWVSCHGAPQ